MPMFGKSSDGDNGDGDNCDGIVNSNGGNYSNYVGNLPVSGEAVGERKKKVKTGQQSKGGGDNNVGLDVPNHNVTYSGDGNDDVLGENRNNEAGKDVCNDGNDVGKSCDGDNGDGESSDGIVNNIGGNDSNDVINPPDSGSAFGQNMEQSLFTIKTNMPIPVLVYRDAFQWEKYGHHILPSNLDLKSHHETGIHQLFRNYLINFLRTDLDGNLVPSSLDLTSHNKPGLHQTFQKSLVEFLCTDFLIEFLCTDLDGNLSFTLNPLTTSKLDHFLLMLPEGLPETTNEDDEEYHQQVWHKKRKHSLVNQIVDIALSATQIPLSIFKNLFHKRFQKHSMLESMLEILKQFYIQIDTEPHDFLLFLGDSSLYTLRCKKCHKPVTVAG